MAVQFELYKTPMPKEKKNKTRYHARPVSFETVNTEKLAYRIHDRSTLRVSDIISTLEELKNETRTIILYEAPHHLKSTLKDLYEAMGDRDITICRELTKRFESAWRTSFTEALAVYEEEEPKGECVIVIRGRSVQEIQEEVRQSWEALTLEEHMEHYLSQGMDKKEAMKAVAKDRGISKRDVYQQLL